MADDIDKASDQEQEQRDRAIAYARVVKKIEPTGHCLECGEPIGDGMRWCNNSSRDDWQRWNPEA